MKKYFFGWANIKFIIVEFIKVGSNKPSFFSKKRLESGIAFGVLIWGCVFWLIKKYTIMSTSDFILWSAVPAVIAGYTLSMIEKAKLDKKDENTEG